MVTQRADLTAIVWTDEKKFKLDGPDGGARIWLRSSPGTNATEQFSMIRRQQGGSGVMVWVGFSDTHKGPLLFIDDSVTAEVYMDMLQTRVFPWYNGLPTRPSIYQHDNAPAHRPDWVNDAIRATGVDVLQWPPHSPDLNPVELVWAQLSQKVYNKGRRQYTSVEALKAAIVREYEKLPYSFFHNILVRTWKNMVNVLLSKGGFSTLNGRIKTTLGSLC